MVCQASRENLEYLALGDLERKAHLARKVWMDYLACQEILVSKVSLDWMDFLDLLVAR